MQLGDDQIFCVDVLDSSAPTRTLSSRDSQTSLEPSLDSQVDKNEEDVFDEGLLFGDSKWFWMFGLGWNMNNLLRIM